MTLKRALLAVFVAALAAFVSCNGPSPPAMAQSEIPRTWYFAEGTTRDGFFEYLSLQNPDALTAHVNITYMTDEGRMGPYVVDVPPVSRGTVFVNAWLEPGLDVSVAVESDVGIVAERPMYFSYKGKWEGGHDVMGVTEPATTWYFAEGTTRDGFEEWLCIQNPQDADVDVRVRYFTTGAVQDRSYEVAAARRFTINVNEEVASFWPDEPEQDVSIEVEASAGVIAERPMYFDYMGDWDGGDSVVGATELGRTWYLAEGYCQWNSDTWLCFLNPGQETAHVVIDYRRGDGAPLAPQALDVPGYSRRTVYANAVAGMGEFSFQIASDQDIMVERPIYFSYRYMWVGGHDNKAIAGTSDEWYLAEGATRHGIDTYLCILNPLPVAQGVTVEYLLEKGGYQAVDFDVPAHSRYTRNVNADIGEGHDVSFRINAFKNTDPVERGEIVVERPVYFLYGGSLAGGHVASGYPL